MARGTPSISSRIARPGAQVGVEYDVLVIGCGHGGKVAASRLARAGQRVCVLERGRGRECSGLFRAMAGVALRPDATAWEAAPWPAELRAADGGLLHESFDHAESMLRPTTSTLLGSYLSDAVSQGAELFSEIDVRFVERRSTGYIVHFEPLALERHRFDAPPLFVRAKIVILAGHGLASKELLLRSHVEGLDVSPLLGQGGTVDGCAMGDDGARGVVDHRGRVFDGAGTTTHDGLLVCDGSTLPAVLGVDPLLTICALAERSATLLARERGWEIDRTSVTEPEPAAEAPLGLRVTERMVGAIRLEGGGAPPALADFSIVCTLAWDDLEALLADPSLPGTSFGTVHAPALSPHALRVIDGDFQLRFTQEGGSFQMMHRLVIEDRSRKRYFVDGHATIPRGVRPDTSTLSFELHAGVNARGTRLGSGEVEVGLRDLLERAWPSGPASAANDR